MKEDALNVILNNIMNGLWIRFDNNIYYKITIPLVIFMFFFGKHLIPLITTILKSTATFLNKRKDNKYKIRRRTQFCNVLESDLASISKCENWNDQYFTDLESEVETEGRYYQSLWSKLRGKTSVGLRKESSLIKAISVSNEKAMHLIGEPGSGKSVALRHLAFRIIKKTKVSNKIKALIPLYINLRDINFNKNEKITADLISDFVLDNVRRGDSDTAAFLRENWKEYQDQGVWFFLFDSFDEIPAILHAEKGSAITKEYEEAIRQFLEGMGECRGILASREFKGPESLAWTKFRILHLNNNKQKELVTNSFLNNDQVQLVLNHIASNISNLSNSPLFLTLLCRFIKDKSAPPINDYELLSSHIERLAYREPDYLKRIYQLTPEQVLLGAERLARLFAEDSTLGLSPTIDQVEKVLDSNDVPNGDIPNFVSALIDSKICRVDVQNTKNGDKRFAFSHRRYQETLFVQHLVKHSDYLSNVELLTEPRWREYTVTFMQTVAADKLTKLFQSAEEILLIATSLQKRIKALEPFSKGCGYFEWVSDATKMLFLIQEGMARRINEIPESFTSQVKSFLEIRWETGDTFDKLKVMQVSGLLPQLTLNKYLEETFTFGSSKAQGLAFNQTTSVTGTFGESIKLKVLEHLASEILNAKDSTEIRRLQAIIAKLPDEIGASHVEKRCLFLRKLVNIIRKIESILYINAFFRLNNTLNSFFNVEKFNLINNTAQSIFLRGIIVYCYSFLIMNVLLHFPIIINKLTNYFNLVIIDYHFNSQTILTTYFLYIVFFIYCVFNYIFRAVGQKLTFKYLIQYFKDIKFLINIKNNLIHLFLPLILIFIIYTLGYTGKFISNEIFNAAIVQPVLIVGMIITIIIGFLMLFIDYYYKIKLKNRVNIFFELNINKNEKSILNTLVSASSWDELTILFNLWVDAIESKKLSYPSEELIRSISSALQKKINGDYSHKNIWFFMEKINYKKRIIIYLDELNYLMMRYVDK